MIANLMVMVPFTSEQMDNILKALKEGDRVEIIPIKDGKVKVIRIKRQDISE